MEGSGSGSVQIITARIRIREAQKLLASIDPDLEHYK
jgi:hypothetical protein